MGIWQTAVLRNKYIVHFFVCISCFFCQFAAFFCVLGGFNAAESVGCRLAWLNPGIFSELTPEVFWPLVLPLPSVNVVKKWQKIDLRNQYIGHFFLVFLSVFCIFCVLGSFNASESVCCGLAWFYPGFFSGLWFEVHLFLVVFFWNLLRIGWLGCFIPGIYSWGARRFQYAGFPWCSPMSVYSWSSFGRSGWTFWKSCASI